MLRNSKKSPNQETGLGNRVMSEGSDWYQNDPKQLNHAHLGPIWYHSEPSDVPYSPNQFLDWDFFCYFLQQDGSKTHKIDKIHEQK